MRGSNLAIHWTVYPPKEKGEKCSIGIRLEGDPSATLREVIDFSNTLQEEIAKMKKEAEKYEEADRDKTY